MYRGQEWDGNKAVLKLLLWLLLSIAVGFGVASLTVVLGF